MGSIDIIDVEYDTKHILKAELGALAKPYVALIIVRPATYAGAVCSLTDLILNDLRESCLYITSSRPFGKILAGLEREKIDTRELRFIDCVSKHTERGGKAEFAAPVAAELSEKISSAIAGKATNLLVDSLSSLLLYNDEKTLHWLVSSVAESVARSRSAAVFIASETPQNRGFLENVAPAFDKTIRIAK